MDNSPGPVVSVIVPVFRQWEYLPGCLQALEEQTFPSDQYEVIVVNNESDSHIPLDVKVFPHCRIVHEPEPGSYKARNAGLMSARGSLIAFTDADCIPQQDWIESAASILRDQPDVHRIAGKVELFYRNPDRKTTVELYETIFAFQQEYKVREQGSSLTANLFVRKEVFTAVGVFMDELKSGGDTEWGKRAQKAGYRIIYAPWVGVGHPARRRWQEIMKKAARLYGGRWELSGKNKSWIWNIVHGIKLLKPSMDDYKRVFSRQSFSMLQKCRVSVVIVLVQIVQCAEHFRLLFFNRPAIR